MLSIALVMCLASDQSLLFDLEEVELRQQPLGSYRYAIARIRSQVVRSCSGFRRKHLLYCLRKVAPEELATERSGYRGHYDERSH